MATEKRPHLIIGCGYTGLAVATARVQAGESVVATSRSEMRRGEIEATGATFAVFDFDVATALPAPKEFETITVLAPAPESLEHAARRMRNIAKWAGPTTPVVVVISTSIYCDTTSDITERTHPAAKTLRAKQWATQDSAALFMRQQGHNIRVVRTPAIYGPGRDHRARLLTQTAFAIAGASATSRIHVEDLANLLIRMAAEVAPPILLACDELPAPTVRVMEEASRILDLPGPIELSLEDAQAQMSERAMQMRLGGHSCRSVVRPYLGVRLKYPTYREGLRACLRGGLGV